MTRYYVAMTIKEQRTGKRLETSIEASHGGVAGVSRIINFELVDKRSYGRPSALVHGNGYHGKISRSIVTIQPVQNRDLALAGSTPGRPQVQQDKLAAKIRQLPRDVLHVMKPEVRGQRPFADTHPAQRQAAAEHVEEPPRCGLRSDRQAPPRVDRLVLRASVFRPIVGALCVVVLLALSIIVYSPLHRDDPQTSGMCPFCHFQSLGFEPAQGQIQVDVPAPVMWHRVVKASHCHASSFKRPHLGRAPPTTLLPA